ncbi:MAG: two-component system, NarL family, nitrate/nitrite response regulator NarL [Mycobacteriales bacterium]
MQPFQREAPIRIAVHSSRRLLRDALAAYLATLPDFTVVGDAADVESLMTLCELAQPDVVLMDAEPGVSAVLRTLKARFPVVHPVLVYEKLSSTDLAEMRTSSLAGMVPFSYSLHTLLAVLRNPGNMRSAPRAGNARLTERQLEILMLISSGHSVAEIAELLAISAGTVQNHKRRLYAKLWATSGADAVARAASVGLMSTPATVDPPPAAANEEGWPALVVVRGRPGCAVDRVLVELVRHKVPYVRVQVEHTRRDAHWLRWHRGPITTVLVDPEPAHWPTGRPAGHRVLVVRSGVLDQAAMVRDLSRGAGGIIETDRVEGQLMAALALAAEGCLVIGGSQARPVARAVISHSAERRSRVPEVTARERDILSSIALGHTVRQTARSLGITTKTVENTQAHLFSKLRVHNRAGALAAAYALGLISPAGDAAGEAGLLG